MTIFWCVSLTVLIVQCFTYDLKITRDDADTTYGLTECPLFQRTTGSMYTCTCEDEYKTMMSKENEIYNCFKPTEVGCGYALTASKQAYLITSEGVNEQILADIDAVDTRIHRVLVWNLHPAAREIGNWQDITANNPANFTLRAAGGSVFLNISNLYTAVWGGLLIKVELAVETTYSDCIILKVKGEATYPLDIDKRLQTHLIPTQHTVPTTQPPTTVVRRPSKAIIDRNERDIALGNQCSLNFRRTQQSGDRVVYRKCTCGSQYITMMSRNYEQYNCLTPVEVGCHYTLMEATKQVFVIHQSNVQERLITRPKDRNCNTINRVLVWNLHPESYERGKGEWVDVTNKTTAKFSIISHPNSQADTQADSYLSISDLNTDAWIGLAVKIEVTGGRHCRGSCLIVKVQGQIQYPINISDMLNKLSAPAPATQPPVYLPERRAKDRHSSAGTTAGIIVGILIAVAAVGIIGLMYYRRRGRTEGDVVKEVADGAVNNHNGDTTTVNGGYENGKCDKSNYSESCERDKYDVTSDVTRHHSDADRYARCDITVKPPAVNPTEHKEVGENTKCQQNNEGDRMEGAAVDSTEDL